MLLQSFSHYSMLWYGKMRFSKFLWAPSVNAYYLQWLQGPIDASRLPIASHHYILIFLCHKQNFLHWCGNNCLYHFSVLLKWIIKFFVASCIPQTASTVKYWKQESYLSCFPFCEALVWFSAHKDKGNLSHDRVVVNLTEKKNLCLFADMKVTWV